MPKKNKSYSKFRARKEQEEIKSIKARIDQADSASEIDRFVDLPLSSRTLLGLKQSGYVRPTDIQKGALLDALKGLDVLGAAKTGSGKTLAFLIPVLEKLYLQSWSKIDGVGAVIISPTRELALQTYQCLIQVGKHHEMSAGLVIGGTTLEKEKLIVTQTNIIICTPGRLLQHMDETPLFNCDNLQVLVLDEADRILDLGFAKTLNAIIQNLPKKRQTLLFSATQNKSVQNLIRLSLKDPRFVNAHEKEKSATPDSLVQAYMVCPLQEKLDVLWSFIRTHTNDKILVFVSSCKQVRLIYEGFRRMRPGTPLLPLFGKQKQSKRVAVFKDFSKKKAAVLVATDIAARGLDFPSVDWVIQLDCPEDVDTYIHRVGRTARYNRDGKALMILLPTEEEEMNKLMEAKKIPITKTEVNLTRIQPVAEKMRAFCAEDPQIKYLAQKSFISYMRSVFLQPNKNVFKVNELPTEEYALSLGLASAPRIKFIKKAAKKHGAATSTSIQETSQFGSTKSVTTFESDEGSDEDNDKQSDEPIAKFDRLRKRTNKDVLSDAFNKIKDDEDSDEDELLKKSSKQTHLEYDDEEDVSKPKSKKQRQKKATRASVLKEELGNDRSHVVFDEEGNELRVGPKLVGQDMADSSIKQQVLEEGSKEFDQAKEKMAAEDVLDRQRYKQMIRERKRLRKEKLRKALGLESNDGEVAVTLGDFGDDDDDEMAQDLGLDISELGQDMISFEDEDEDDMNLDIDLDEDEPIPSEPKSSKKRSSKKSKRKHTEDDNDDSTMTSKVKRSKRSVEDDEELAMKLLGVV